jgi:hypothetical protein
LFNGKPGLQRFLKIDCILIHPKKILMLLSYCGMRTARNVFKEKLCLSPRIDSGPKPMPIA